MPIYWRRFEWAAVCDCGILWVDVGGCNSAGAARRGVGWSPGSQGGGIGGFRGGTRKAKAAGPGGWGEVGWGWGGIWTAPWSKVGQPEIEYGT
jgi:hypothetical protein